VTRSHRDDAIAYPPKRRGCTHPATVTVLLALAAAGCGSAAGSTSPTVERGALAAQVMSASCSSAATSAVSSGITTTEGRRAGPSVCVLVLTDGQRFKCSGPAFARSTPTPTKLEHAKACVIISRLMLPPSVRAIITRIAAARTCLTSKGLRVTGGPVFPPQAPDSADGELITEGALIAFYTNQRTAERLEPQVKQDARRSNAQVVRNGAVTVLWIRPPASGLRDTVSQCALG
jgi:hypothetical protein